MGSIQTYLLEINTYKQTTNRTKPIQDIRTYKQTTQQSRISIRNTNTITHNQLTELNIPNIIQTQPTKDYHNATENV